MGAAVDLDVRRRTYDAPAQGQRLLLYGLGVEDPLATLRELILVPATTDLRCLVATAEVVASRGS